MSKKPTVLMILDGYGLNDTTKGNAVAEGKTPVMDKLMAEYPFVKGNASGMAVGLPEGQMGNSEVGHLNMGAGRIIYEQSGCCCGGNCNEESVEAAKETLSSGANVKVLGGGCDKCNALEKNVNESLSELGMTDEIDHVTDFGQIAAMGVMSTPALVIDNKVVSMGKVLSKDDVIKALKKVRG